MDRVGLDAEYLPIPKLIFWTHAPSQMALYLWFLDLIYVATPFSPSTLVHLAGDVFPLT